MNTPSDTPTTRGDEPETLAMFARRNSVAQAEYDRLIAAQAALKLPCDVEAAVAALEQACTDMDELSPLDIETALTTLRQSLRGHEDAVIERCARACEAEANEPQNADAFNYRMGCRASAAAIRAMKP